MRNVHVTVTGDVQGVGYRYTLRLVATEAGVGGWVRNLRDGSVEASLAGPDDAVSRVLAWMGDGPPGAHVAGLRVSERTDSGDAADGFDVRPTG